MLDGISSSGKTVSSPSTRSKSVLLSDNSNNMTELVEPSIRPGVETVSVKRVPFAALYVLWILLVGVVSAAILYFLGEGNFIECLFTAIDGLSGSGLNIGKPVATFSGAGKWVTLITVQAGSLSLASLLPVAIRLHYLRRNGLFENKSLRTFNLDRFHRVPQTIVEYKSLSILLKLVLFYHLFVYLFYATCITVWIFSSQGTLKHVKETLRGDTNNEGTSIATFVVFTVVSTFSNCGFSITKNSLLGFKNDYFFLFCVNALALHGNVLFPIFLRW